LGETALGLAVGHGAIWVAHPSNDIVSRVALVSDE
jgi:hypothetical protein